MNFTQKSKEHEKIIKYIFLKKRRPIAGINIRTFECSNEQYVLNCYKNNAIIKIILFFPFYF